MGELLIYLSIPKQKKGKKMNENKIIEIEDKKFLHTISRMLDYNLDIYGLEDDLYYILDTKTLNLQNIQNLFEHLVYSQEEEQLYYFFWVKELIEDRDMCPFVAFRTVEEMIEDEQYLYIKILTYFCPEMMNNINYEEVA